MAYLGAFFDYSLLALGKGVCFTVVLHGKPILERYCGTESLRTIPFHVLLVSVLYELCGAACLCVQLLSASSLLADRVGVVSQ